MHFYIHIPFCRRKCLYCDFYSVTDTASVDKYTDAVLKEIEDYKGMNADTVYIGGGTPTCNHKALLRIIKGVKEKLILTDDTEFTVEANPGTVDKEILTTLYNLGVNRLSFGIQSFVDNELKQLGRIHSASEGIYAVETAKNVGFKNISIDLMLGIPLQTKESLDYTLACVEKLNIQHVSAYSLIVEPDTPFYNMKIELPDEDTERELYYYARNRLKENGIIQYEISNFAIPGYESRHNCSYWLDKEYIGIGAAAYSFYKNERFCNCSDIKTYIEGKGRHVDSVFISPEERNLELFMLGLRMTEGIEYNGEYADRVNPLIEKGLLEVSESRLKLTTRGIDLANLVFMEFLNE